MARFIKKLFRKFPFPVLVLAATACSPKVSQLEANQARWAAHRASVEYRAEHECNQRLPGESWVAQTSRINSDPKVCNVVVK